MKNDKVYAVVYRDYRNRKHLCFLPKKQDVDDLRRNYDVEEVNYANSAFLSSNELMMYT